MSDWPAVPIGEVVQVIGGGTPKKSEARYYGGDIPWVTPKDMKTSVVSQAQINITDEAVKQSTARIAPRDSVLIVVRSGVLKHTVPVAVNQVPVAINQDMKALICSGRIDAGYLARFIKSRSSEILSWVRATTADNFPIEKLKRMEISLPILAEQKRIAAVLDQVDTLRAKRREAIALLDDLAQSIFLDMFGDLKESARLADFAEVQGGLQLSGARNSKPLEVPYLRVANVYRGYLWLDEVKTLRATPQEIERTRLVKGDLVVVEGHGNPNEIGRTALWDGSIDLCTHQNHLIRIRLDRQYLIPEYVEMYLNSAVGRRHLLSSANTTSGLNTISTGAVKENPIAVPDMGRQHAFLSRLSRLQKVKQRHLTHLATLDELFASLQHRAFSGTLWDHEATGEAA